MSKIRTIRIPFPSGIPALYGFRKWNVAYYWSYEGIHLISIKVLGEWLHIYKSPKRPWIRNLHFLGVVLQFIWVLLLIRFLLLPVEYYLEGILDVIRNDKREFWKVRYSYAVTLIALIFFIIMFSISNNAIQQL